jgi:2-oxoisovalerate dehydrogenase E1 component
MYNRAKVIDENFTKFVKESLFPESDIKLTAEELGLTNEDVVDLFESQVMNRHLDFKARELKEKNLSFYTIGSSGHEGSAAIAKIYRQSDMAFLHYRDAAFLIQRSKKDYKSTILYDMMLSFVASSDDPISAGRHKVLGSLPLYVPPQTSTISSHLPKAVGAAYSIALNKRLNRKSVLPNDAAIICSFGDASLNHSTAQGAINTAQWLAYRKLSLPILFVCEDNGIGISVRTPDHWVRNSMLSRKPIRYFYGDGLHLLDAIRATKESEQYIRKTSSPTFLHLKTMRLMGHAGSDMETEYKELKEIEANEFQDPLLHSARILKELNIMSSDEIINLYESVRNRIDNISNTVIDKPKLESAEAVMDSIIPDKRLSSKLKSVSELDRENAFGKRNLKQISKKRNLAQNINFTLRDILLSYPNTCIFGEDVAKKGGVYKVTNGLYESFGSNRVFNTLLDEQTILGTAIGMAHNGWVPIPEIQFLAYVHNAEDQIRGEAATLSFFSDKQFTNPMVIRIAGLAYQKGFGGHFHNDNSIAVFRDIPGLILACPSNGADAVKMLREAVRLADEEQRIVIFLEPIALYMTKDLHETGDEAWLFEYPDNEEEIELGEFASYGKGKDLLIITYGNGYYLSRQAERILSEKYKVNATILDLRWLMPLNELGIAKVAKDFKHILIVDECRKTASLSEEIVTSLVERLNPIPQMKRLTGHDTFIPLGNAWEFVLPDKEAIVNSALDLLGKKK